METEVFDKIRSVKEAVKLIPDGSSVAVSGFGVTRCPISLVHEMIRAEKRNLTILETIGSLDADLLVGAGCVKKIVYGGGSLEPPIGPLNRVNEAIVQKEVEAEEYSGTSMCFKFLAGALGIPYIPIKSLLGSDLLPPLIRKGVVKVEKCPFTGETFVLLQAVNPDFALIHAQRADAEGNVIIYGARWDNKELAFASKTVIVTVEEIVDSSLIRSEASNVVIPSYRVHTIIHVPFGAHPTGVYKYYDYDREHLEYYVKLSREKETFKKYLDEYVFSVENHMEYLKKIGVEKLLKLRADPLLGY